MKLPLTLALDKDGLPRIFSDPAAALQDGSHDVGELFLVELQGKLEVQLEEEEQPALDSPASSSAAGQRIGKLDMSLPSRPTLLIGHHRLVGQIVKLNTPLAILKHTLPPRTASPFNTSASSALRPPPTSSPLQVHQQNQSETASSPLKRDRSTTPLAEVVEQLADTTESAHKRQKPTTSEDKFEQADLLNSGGAISPATPLPPRLTKTTALGDGETAKAIPAPESSPFLAPLPPSTALAHRTPLPKTPLNVSELKTGKHEIAGIIRSKILFSKRPEPVVKLDDQSEED